MLGLVCHYLTSDSRGKLINAMDEHHLQLGRLRSGKYTIESIRATYLHNVSSLRRMLPTIVASGIRHFRVSSSLLPLADQVERSTWDNDVLRRELASVGSYVRANGIRLTTHPGQFCVLSSDDPRVVDNTVAELSIHGWIFDSMGLDRSPLYAINVHGGKRGRLTPLKRAIDLLPDSARRRLTLENDETCYSVTDLVDVHVSTGVPVCFDSHHHVFNDGCLDMDEAYEAACLTWPDGVRPLQHVSSTEPNLANGSFSDRRKHSAMAHHVPEVQIRGLRNGEVDVECEFKMKNIAIVDLARRFEVPLA